jgi:hypothetical protein
MTLKLKLISAGYEYTALKMTSIGRCKKGIPEIS